MNVARLLERSALHFPAWTALEAGDRSWTYEALDDEVSALAGGLPALGLQAGERIACPSTRRARSSRRTFARAASF